MVGIPLPEASRMASAYPAAWLGLEREVGRIVAGQRADFAVVDDKLKVVETWIGGVPHKEV
jgi:N-acetylglucosamine-6-phosphate deacetylase